MSDQFYNDPVELVCPSCGVRHRTEDHRLAFEINCVCGYSILMPDEDALRRDAASVRAGHDPSLPTAMEAEDEALVLPLDAGDSFTLPSNQEAQPNGGDASDGAPQTLAPAFELNLGSAAGLGMAPGDLDLGDGDAESAESAPDFNDPAMGSEQMTAPEDLPREMVYDPFELPQVAAAQSLTASRSEGALFGAPGGTAFGAPGGAAAGMGSQRLTPSSAPEPTPAQSIVERSQLASMGQFLGSSYRLECRNLSGEALERIADRCQVLVDDRPWLATELRRRGIDLARLSVDGELNNVPELVAVEIYLACFEHGGNCAFDKVES